MKRIAAIILAGSLSAVLVPTAGAQTLRYPVKHALDFDLWCTEVQHIDWHRCDKRLPEDVQKFEAYRSVIERYEIPYLQEKDTTLRFNENILHNDPVDKRPDSTVAKPPDPMAGDK